MQITSNTKWSEFAVLANALTKESEQKLMQAAEDFYKPCHMLTVDEFWGVENGDLYAILGDTEDPTVLQEFWCRRFKQFEEELTKAIEKLDLKRPGDEALHNGCVKMSAQENMLIFLRDYFGLPSFEDAGKRTIGEYVLARKDRYNEAVVRRNYEAKTINNLKAKKR